MPSGRASRAACPASWPASAAGSRNSGRCASSPKAWTGSCWTRRRRRSQARSRPGATPPPHSAMATSRARSTRRARQKAWRRTSSPGSGCRPDEPARSLRHRGSLTEEERMVQGATARLVDEKVLPVIQKHFEDHTFPRELVPEIAALGLLGSSITGYGCAGMNSVSYGLICQELERGDSGIRSFVSVQSSLCMYPIAAFGSEAQREKYLPRMAAGELIGCFGLTEPHGGSDPVNMKTHAKRRGKDWVLNGAKMWITNAPIADLAVVWAKTEEGIRGFIVEKGTRGFATPEIERKFSLRASATGALYLEDVVVPEEN